MFKKRLAALFEKQSKLIKTTGGYLAVVLLFFVVFVPLMFASGKGETDEVPEGRPALISGEAAEKDAAFLPGERNTGEEMRPSKEPDAAGEQGKAGEQSAAGEQNTAGERSIAGERNTEGGWSTAREQSTAGEQSAAEGQPIASGNSAAAAEKDAAGKEDKRPEVQAAVQIQGLTGKHESEKGPAKAAGLPPVLDITEMIFPAEGEMIREVGMVYSPTFGDYRYHNGIDITVKEAVEARAVLPGKVISVESSKGEGKKVVIDHGSGWRSEYAHLETVAVKPDGTVKKGQTIGFVGQPGLNESADGPHLHFSLLRNGEVVNPADYLPGL